VFFIRGEGLFFPFVPFGRAERENREKGEQKEGGSFFLFSRLAKSIINLLPF